MNCEIDFSSKTDTGKTRTNNEDNCIADKETGFIAVADGMGGHNNGELASKLAIQITFEKIKEYLSGSAKETGDSKYSLSTNILLKAVDAANREIFNQSKSDEKNKGMGTTFTGVLFNGQRISLVHIGDSRGYIIRNSKMRQITEDHSFVMEQCRKGIITPEEAERSPYKNVLTKALGVKEDADCFVYEEKLKEGDILLLATDGLTKMIKDSDILRIINEHYENIEQACSSLILEANKNGGEDNITVAIAKIKKESIINKFKKIISHDA